LNKVALYSCAVVLSVCALGQAAHAATGVLSSQRIPIFTVLPARGVDRQALQLQAASSSTVPFFSSSVKSPLDKKTYSFEMVGTNPMTNKLSTTVKYVPLLVRLHFRDGTILDPPSRVATTPFRCLSGSSARRCS